MRSRRTTRRSADGPAARWDNTPEPMEPMLTEVQHGLPAKVRKGKHVTAAAVIVAIMVVDWLVMAGTPLISIILAGAVVAAAAASFSASARHEDEREARADNFIEAAYPLLGVKGLSRTLVSVGRWKRTPLPSSHTAEKSEKAGKAEGQEEVTNPAAATDAAPAPETTATTDTPNSNEADTTDTAPQKTVKPSSSRTSQRAKNLSAASWIKARRAGATVRHNLTEPGHPSSLIVHYGRTVDATNPEWAGKLLAIANRELSDGTVEFKIDSVNNVRKKLVLKAVTTATEETINETEEQKRERVITEAAKKLLGDEANARFVRDEQGVLTEIHIEHHRTLELEMNPSSKARITRAMLTRIPGSYRCSWDAQQDLLSFMRRKEFPAVVSLPAHAQPMRQRFDDGASYKAYKKFEILLGLNEDGQWATWNPTKDAHLLITGRTGYGKTISLHNIIQQITQAGYRVWLCDGKWIELLGYDEWPNVELIANSVPTQIRMLKHLHEIMQERYTLLRKRQATAYDFDPIFFVCDELSEMKGNIADFYATHKVKGMPSKSEVDSWIGSLARLARKALIHMVVGLQRPDASLMNGETRENFGGRMSLGQMGRDASIMMWENASIGCAVAGAKGRALAMMNGEPTMIQSILAPNPDPLDSDYDESKVKNNMPTHTLYTMKTIKELEEYSQVYNEKNDEFEETPTPWTDYLTAPILAADGEPIEIAVRRSEALKAQLKVIESSTPATGEPTIDTMKMPTITPEVLMSSDTATPQSVTEEFDTAVWGKEQTESAQSLGESDLVEVEGEWVIVNSLVKDPFGSGDLILDYRTPHGESGSFTLTQGQQLNTRRARSEEDIEAYDKTREET